MGWCNVVEDSWFNRHDFGVVILNYGYPEGADRFRAIVNENSTSQVIYNLYPGADMLKKYAISVHIHSEYKMIETKLLGPGLKGGNPDMKGDFEIVDCRTLTGEGKENCRLLSLSCSTEFLAYLATKPKNYRYNLYGMRVFINGGKRLDSTSEYNTPQLPPNITAKLIKSNKNQIMTYAANRIGLGKAMAAEVRYIYRKSNKKYINNMPFLSLYTGETPNQRYWTSRIDPPTMPPTTCLLYTSPSPRDRQKSRMPSSA